MNDQHIAIIAPCYNEGVVAVRFVEELEQVLARLPQRFTVVMVDDASTDDTASLLQAHIASVPNVRVQTISLAYNMGHQEAIYQGLQFASTLEAHRFVVMDSDGEDDPGAIAELVGITDAPIVFVARGKRSESLGFRMGYWLYKRIFRSIAGRSISFGNYSMIDRTVLHAVLDRSFTHYAAFLSRQRVPSRIIVRDRRPRIDGTSKMSFRSLSMHACARSSSTAKRWSPPSCAASFTSRSSSCSPSWASSASSCSRPGPSPVGRAFCPFRCSTACCSAWASSPSGCCW
ncbi:MAG: glycosyltransferase [Flavobacteriales bacterium]|nr:glycosyltransferase [Flavobacteriales bacterium]